MKFKWLTIALMLMLLFAACSDEQKEEAAQVEAEYENMMGEDSAAQPVSDTTAAGEAMDAQAVPETPEPQAPEPTGPSGSGYAVQVASCEEYDYAEYLVEKYKARGYEAYSVTFDHDGQTYYRVRLGPFETESEAQQIKTQVADRYSITAWIDMQM